MPPLIAPAPTNFDTLYGKGRASAIATRLLDRVFAVKVFRGHA